MWLLICLCALAYAQDGPRVTTTQGVVVGQRIEDGDYLAFYGVHYGGDTAGENRFKAPTPPPVYQEEFLATDNTIRCAQPSSQQLIGTEDCLRLNIHTKNLTTPKPVMVWIEGEDYDTTGSVDSFKNLVEEDLIVVSINYRLSIFGFLCLRVTDAPGNAGLKDIVQGLKWIKENIDGFGGDPNNIILLGHGSGAAMVDLITLSPMSQNLIHKAIVLSGSGLAPWAVSYDPIGYVTRVVEKLGFPDRSVEDMAKILAVTDNLLLNSVLTDFQLYNASLLFAPCVENATLNPSDTFLSDAPINILRSGNYIHIPYVAGFVDREGTLRIRQAINDKWLARMEYFFGDFIQVDLAFESEDKRKAVTRNIRQNYFAESTVNMNTIEDYIEYQGDSLILYPVIRATKERALTSRANVWLFKFTYVGTHNSDWPFPQIPVTGAPHGVLINYLLNYDLKGIDQPANKAITRRFAGFAYTGIPERLPNSTTSNIDVKWESINGTRVPTLLISGGQIAPNVSIVSQEIAFGINGQTTEFWDPIIAAHYRAPGPVSSANTLFSFGLVVLAAQTSLRLLF